MKPLLFVFIITSVISCSQSKSTVDKQSAADSATQAVKVKRNMNIDESVPSQVVDKINEDVISGKTQLFQGRIYKSGNEPFTRYALYVSDTESYPVVGNQDFYAFIETKQDAVVVLAGEKFEQLNQSWIRVLYIQNQK